MKTNESAEMYLEAILLLKEQKKDVRAIDVVHHTGYSKPSVSRAIGILKNNKYIEVDKKGFITLTESGRALAEKIYERHTIITEFLISLGVDHTTASEDACKMEHIISDASFDAIKKHSADN